MLARIVGNWPAERRVIDWVDLCVDNIICYKRHLSVNRASEWDDRSCDNGQSIVSAAIKVNEIFLSNNLPNVAPY